MLTKENETRRRRDCKRTKQVNQHYEYGSSHNKDSESAN
ncbi:hypothetical protein LINGRAHAP2_LOCUS28012, partial [Linum grandiflorum]